VASSLNIVIYFFYFIDLFMTFKQAMSMLLLNHKMAATEAWENGLVMDVLKPANFMEQVDSRVKAMAAMPSKVNSIDSSHTV